jgi:hypothetical protein
MDSLGGFLIEALKRKAAQALAEAQAQQAQQAEAQAKFAQAQAKIAEAQAQFRAQAQARQGAGGAPVLAQGSVPLGRPAVQTPSAPRRAPARPVEVEERAPEAGLLASFRGGRALLSALVFSEALLPPLSLRERGPHG